MELSQYLATKKEPESVSAFARRIGLPRGTVNQIANGGGSPNARTAKIIIANCEGMVTLDDLVPDEDRAATG